MLKGIFWRSVSKWPEEWTIWPQYEYSIETLQREIACELCPGCNDQEEWGSCEGGTERVNEDGASESHVLGYRVLKSL